MLNNDLEPCFSKIYYTSRDSKAGFYLAQRINIAIQSCEHISSRRSEYFFLTSLPLKTFSLKL